MSRYLPKIISYVDTFMRCDNFDILEVKYPASTVLLDLTASEMCIEKVAQLVKDKNLLSIVLKELRQSLVRKIPRNA